ncbi:hypothetical protein L0Y59_00860 [Candidatus Uhrbacteria bacterium]|nr:hypothetical protein [Candidatus Uhrbacteria bacterium]
MILKSAEGDCVLRTVKLTDCGRPSQTGVNGGKRCLECGAVLSIYNPFPVPICQPCAKNPRIRMKYRQ